jgi:hypothetical protein
MFGIKMQHYSCDVAPFSPVRIRVQQAQIRVLGHRADRLRVGEALHYFRCKACGGWIDARDLAWIEDHEGPLPHPAQDGMQ